MAEVSQGGLAAGALEALKAALEAGRALTGTRDLAGGHAPGAARNALDCALIDLEPKRAGQRAWTILGRSEPKAQVYPPDAARRG